MAELLGKKIGMTHIFADNGEMAGVTVIEAGPCTVLKVLEKSLQVGFDKVPERRLKRPVAGYFKKVNLAPRKIIKEVKKELDREYKVGDELKADLFKPGDLLDITGISIGKGFQGGMKRWHWKGGPMTHGSTSHRRIGSIGSTTTPGRVWKGHHLPGHMGDNRVTVQNIKLVKVDAENNLLVVNGAVPGHNNGYVVIKNAVKRKIRAANAPQPVIKKPAAKKAK